MSRTSSIGDSAELEGNLTLSDRLKAFKSSQFDPDSYVSSKCQTMNEKEIRNLCSLLIELKKASAEEMRRSVYANYSAFIRTSREISDLEGQLLSLRNLLSSQSALVHNLAERVQVKSLWTNSEDSTGEDITSSGNGELPNAEEWLIEFLDNLEVLLAERRVDEAMETLDKGESLAREARKRNTMSPTAMVIIENAIREQRQKLADHLAETASQSSTRGVELRSTVLALKKLGDGPRAHTLLLQSHQQKLDSAMQSLRSLSTSYGGVYATTLSRLVFSAIAQATSDSLVVFGEEPTYTSELVTWAVKQTEAFALLLKRHVLSSSAAAGGFRVVAECIHICFGHCALLEARGLALSPVLMRHFRSNIEQALSSNLRRIEESTAAIAARDDWSLTFPPVGERPLSSTASLSSSMASQPRLSSSANRFNTMVQDLFEDVGPLETLQLDAPALEGVLQVFNSYVKLLVQALPGSTDNEENLEGSSHKIVRMAETETEQLALLANASLLADELIPRAAVKLLPLTNRMDTPATSKRASDRQSHHLEQREWKRKLQRSVDQLRDSFCRLHALDLIFSEEGDIHLNALMYITMDDHTEEPEWFPSQIFQKGKRQNRAGLGNEVDNTSRRDLFTKATRIASITTEMFVGRERFATVLLMRLIDTVILWLSDDQNFWQEVEEGQKPLGPFGLQQLYLDMEFVLLFSSQGRFLSRHLHQVIKNIIQRAIDAVSASGVDPYSVLPEEDWFAEVAQIAIKMLSGKANFGSIEQNVYNNSPTASASARSVSSVRTPGSN